MSQQLILSYMAVKTGSPISKLILLKLADNADSHGVCFPSCEYLAQYCEISLRTVKSHLYTLEKGGFIKRIQRFDKKGRQRSNLYQLRIPDHRHIEQGNSYTREGDQVTFTEGDRTAHIIDQKEKDLQEGGNSQPKLPKASPSEMNPAQQIVTQLLSKEGEWPVYQEFYQHLQQRYPNVNVIEQLNAMRSWLYINEEKRKPVEQLESFVNNWLRRRAEADQKRKNHLQQHSAALMPRSGIERAADQAINNYRQRGQKHPIENYIHNMLKQHKAKG